METILRYGLCTLLMLGVMSLPSHSLSSETGGSDVTSYPTIQAFLGPIVTGLPTVIIKKRYILSFPLDLLEKFLKCLCDERNTKCSLKASIPNYIASKINHTIYSVDNTAGAVAGKKDKLLMAYYKCRYKGGTKQGSVECSVDMNESLIPDNSQWPPTDQDVCDFRCIYFHWTLLSQKKEQSVHYEHFGVGPSPDTGKFCIRPSEDVDQGRIGDGHKGDSHDDKGSGDPGTSNTVAGITDSTGRNTGSMATSSTDSTGMDNSSTDSYYSNIGSTASRGTDNSSTVSYYSNIRSTASRGTDNGNTDSYNSIIGSTASRGTDNGSTDSYYSNIGSTASRGTDNSSTVSYYSNIRSTASRGTDNGNTDSYNSIIGSTASRGTDNGSTDSYNSIIGISASSSADRTNTDGGSTDSYNSIFGSSASSSADRTNTDGGSTDSYNSIIGNSATSSTDSTDTDNSSTDSYNSIISISASSSADRTNTVGGSTDSYNSIIGNSATSSTDSTNTDGGSTDSYSSNIGNSATSSTDSTNTGDGSTNSKGRSIGGTATSSTDSTVTDNSSTDSYKSDIGSTASSGTDNSSSDSYSDNIGSSASSSTDSSGTDNNSADGGNGNNDCTASSSTCSATTEDARKDGHNSNIGSTASSSTYSANTDDDTKDSHNNNTGSTAGITTDSSDTDNDTTDSDGKKSGYMPIDVKDNVRDSDIKDDSNKDIDIQDDSNKDSDIKDDSSRDSGNKVGFGPTHHITDNRSDVEFLLVCIAFGASVLANIVLGVCLWCSRRRQRRSQAELNELTGVENLTYFGEDNVRAETSFGNSRYGVDRISAADIDISTNQRDTEVPLGTAAVGFVNNGFIPFNNSGEKSLNVNHFEDSDPSASSNNISTQHATQSDVNYESFDAGPSAQVTTENVDEPHYAIPRHSQVHVQGTRSTRPAPDQRLSPRLDSSPYGTSQLPEPDPNSSNNFRGTGNEYVDEASLWGAREPQLLTDAGQAVAIIDDQRPQRKSQGSEFTMRSIANGVSGSSAANCGDMDGLYTEPRENVYSEI